NRPDHDMGTRLSGIYAAGQAKGSSGDVRMAGHALGTSHAYRRRTVAVWLCAVSTGGLGAGCTASHSPNGEARQPATAKGGVNGHEFIRVPGGIYWVGAEAHARNPHRLVRLAAFDIATTETTNAQFARFAAATGYITDAERRGEGQTFEIGMADWQ